MRKNKTVALGLITTILFALLIPVSFAAFSITTTRSTFTTGSTLTFMTSGASANSLITAVIYDPTGDVAYVTEFVSASDGTSVHSIQIPANWATGTYKIEAKIDPSGPTAQKIISIVAPTIPVTPPTEIPSSDEITKDPVGVADKLATADPSTAASALEKVREDVAATVLKNMDSVNAGKIIEAMKVEKAAVTIQKMDPTSGGKIIEKVETTKAANIIKTMDVSTAGSILNKVEPTKTTQILKIIEVSSSARIVEKMEVNKIAQVIEATSEEETDYFAELMNEVQKDIAGEVLLGVQTTKSSDIVRAMATKNITATAKRVEAALKQRLKPGVDPETIQRKVAEIADTIVTRDINALVNIFVEIVKLPETPLSVAIIMESMQLTNVYTVITAWVEAEEYTELAQVFSYFSQEFLETVYLGMSTAERQVLYPYLESATKAALPEVGEIQILDLSITPKVVLPNEKVTISFKARNAGAETAIQILTLRVDGVTETTERVILEVGETVTLVWTTSKSSIGTYTVTVNGETATFTVATPEFKTDNLKVTPSTVEEGESVTISVDVENIGKISSSYTINLLINGLKIDSETVTLGAEEKESVTFTVTEDIEGDYEVEVDGLTASFTVKKVEIREPFPWIYVLIVILVIAIAGYFYMQQRKESE